VKKYTHMNLKRQREKMKGATDPANYEKKQKKTGKNKEVKNEHLHREEQQGETKEEHRYAEGQMFSEEDVVRTG
jgi:hypothetical protein